MDIVERNAWAVYTWDVYEIPSYCFCLFIAIIGSWKGEVSVWDQKRNSETFEGRGKDKVLEKTGKSNY